MVIKNLENATTALAAFIPGKKSNELYTLERMRSLMDFLGNPQNKLKIVHVAGTSGKTSTCYYIASLLREAGYKVGLTVSPHVVAVNDRLQINLKPLAELEYCSALNEFLDLVKKSAIKPTYFELLVAFAFWEFERQKVDWTVVEVGMGGLLDGTNVVNRDDKICVITDIGLDHVNVLGNTVAEIAAQKAGIIQADNKVFSYGQNSEALGVLQQKCAEKNASLEIVEPKNLGKDFAFLPLFQQRNFVLAEAATDWLLTNEGAVSLGEYQVAKAAKVHIPARMETFKLRSKTVILDGAHNAQKLRALVDSINAQSTGQPLASLVSFAAGDDYRLNEALKVIAKVSDSIIVTSFAGERDSPKVSMDLKFVEAILANQKFNNVRVLNNPETAFAELMKCPEPILLVTGSFYLLNHIRPLVLKLEDDQVYRRD